MPEHKPQPPPLLEGCVDDAEIRRLCGADGEPLHSRTWNRIYQRGEGPPRIWMTGRWWYDPTVVKKHFVDLAERQAHVVRATGRPRKTPAEPRRPGRPPDNPTERPAAAAPQSAPPKKRSSARGSITA